jgi:hypothetical protein
VITVAVLLLAPFHVSVWVALGCVAFVAALGYAMSSSYQWIELQGDVIRGRKLLTRRVVERPVAGIVRVTPLHSAATGPIENAVMDTVLQTSNRGYELRLHDGVKMGLVRGDMDRLDEFMAALRELLGKRWVELTAPWRSGLGRPSAGRAEGQNRPRKARTGSTFCNIWSRDRRRPCRFVRRNSQGAQAVASPRPIRPAFWHAGCMFPSPQTASRVYSPGPASHTSDQIPLTHPRGPAAHQPLASSFYPAPSSSELPRNQEHGWSSPG